MGFSTQSVETLPPRPVWRSLWRGARQHCPACGNGGIFARFLKVSDACGSCGEALCHHRADDAPPYFTILLVGHLVLPLVMWLEMAAQPAMWLHLVLWLPLVVLLTLWLLPMVKGAVVALQWALYMHGFDPTSDERATKPYMDP